MSEKSLKKMGLSASLFCPTESTVDEVVAPSRIRDVKLNRTFMNSQSASYQCNNRTEICVWDEGTSPMARTVLNSTMLSRDWNDTFDENNYRDTNHNTQIQKKTAMSNVEVIVLR